MSGTTGAVLTARGDFRFVGGRAGEPVVKAEVPGGFMTHWSHAYQEEDGQGGGKVRGFSTCSGLDTVEPSATQK